MTIEQIIKLSDIGFTADEIKQLSNGGTDPPEIPNPQTPPETLNPQNRPEKQKIFPKR